MILRYPIDVLLLTGDDPHAHDNGALGLYKCLEKHSAIRTYGFTMSREQAFEYLDKGIVNTIFINPRHISYEDPFNWDKTEFILNVRKKYPDIFFVIYAHERTYEVLCEDNSQFKNYFYLPIIWGSRYSDNFWETYEKEVDRILQKCEEWHKTRYSYDIAISFAGEDREVASQIAKLLKQLNNRVFFDEFEESIMLGKNLYSYLHNIYSEQCRYCAMLISKSYSSKAWTNHERISTQERALFDNQDYILPIRIDETKLDGLPKTIGYLDIRKGINEIVAVINRKLWVDGSQQKKYLSRTLY